jgi:hypothetical protein
VVNYNKISTKSCGLGRRLWLSAALSRAKAVVGPSPMAWLGLAQTGPAWPGSWLWARPGTSLNPRTSLHFDSLSSQTCLSCLPH